MIMIFRRTCTIYYIHNKYIYNTNTTDLPHHLIIYNLMSGARALYVYSTRDKMIILSIYYTTRYTRIRQVLYGGHECIYLYTINHYDEHNILWIRGTAKGIRTDWQWKTNEYTDVWGGFSVSDRFNVQTIHDEKINWNS